ncbi:MAG: hypothetical protein ABIS18_08150 [Actinomycetota bacterium]
MDFEMSIEVLDGEFPASTWSHGHGDALVETAFYFGATEWLWHHHSWGVVLDLAFADEESWERFLLSPAVQAAFEAVPLPVAGVFLHRGWGGTSGVDEPRRPRPFAGADAAALPVPDDYEFEERSAVWTDGFGRRVSQHFPAWRVLNKLGYPLREKRHPRHRTALRQKTQSSAGTATRFMASDS